MTAQSARHRIGTGPLTLDRDVSVFINCPFDNDFKPVFNGIVFATICCGFIPRCAIESGDAAVTRIVRIVRAVHTSKYSIHDLSRCRGEGESNIARFNMPLELGMAMGERFRDETMIGAHDWLVIVPERHTYSRVLSDLAGYDPIEYDGSKEGVVSSVMSWLATRPDAVHCPTPMEVIEVLPHFESEMEGLHDSWRGRVPWSDVLLAALRVAENAGLVPNVTTESGPQ